MILYEGYEIKHPKQKKEKILNPQRRLFPYRFHIEDLYGDDVYMALFPLHNKFKGFVFNLIFFTIMIIIMRISIVYV